MSKALLIVDVQNDFCPRGALAVSEGDKIIPILNKYIFLFSKSNYPIIASRDWHPRKTEHFVTYGGPWPPHCIQRTKGARFHPKLKLPRSAIVISKGMDWRGESYSAFLAMDKKGRSLREILKGYGVKEIYVGGLATDYCVKASVLDARKQGLATYLLTDAIRGVNLSKGDSARAIKEMKAAGVKTVTIAKVKTLLTKAKKG